MGESETPDSLRKILIVDDEPGMRLLVKETLAESGLRVLEAADGESGLAMARKEQPDLILLDIVMPGMDGYEFLRHLSASPETRQLRVVMLTALSGLQTRIRERALGSSAHITKPFRPEALRAEILRLLEEEPG